MESANGPSRRPTGLEDLPDVMWPKRAFAAIGVSAPTGYGLLRRNELRGIKIGSSWRITKSEIFRFLKLSEPAA